MAKDKRGSEPSSDAERYKEVATQALEMVDWCIGYLVGAGKESIAGQLAKNRSQLRNRMGEPSEPLPTSDE